MLKLQRSEDPDRIVLAVSGRLGVDNVHLLLRTLDAEPRDTALALALGELRLIDRFGAAYLARCEADGIALLGCPSFIRLWIDSLVEEETASVRRSTPSG